MQASRGWRVLQMGLDLGGWRWLLAHGPAAAALSAHHHVPLNSPPGHASRGHLPRYSSHSGDSGWGPGQCPAVVHTVLRRATVTASVETLGPLGMCPLGLMHPGTCPGRDERLLS